MPSTCPLFIRMLSTALLLAAATCAQAEGVLAQLYSARPPPGSAFVRVITPDATPLSVRVGNARQETVSVAQPASAYVVIAEKTRYPVSVQGQVSQHEAPAAGAFLTLIAQQHDQAWQFTSIEDPADANDGLKAALRFYNVARNCPTARVSLDRDGPNVFADTPSMGAASRSINPVAATLVGWCGERSASLTLPALKAGDHYSFFLIETDQALQLVGQRNRTEEYTK